MGVKHLLLRDNRLRKLVFYTSQPLWLYQGEGITERDRETKTLNKYRIQYAFAVPSFYNSCIHQSPETHAKLFIITKLYL